MDIDKENEGIKQWINPEKTIAVSVNFFDAAPDIPSIKKLESEEESYDAEFTEHPLSQARKLIRQIEEEIEFGSKLDKAKRFKK